MRLHAFDVIFNVRLIYTCFEKPLAVCDTPLCLFGNSCLFLLYIGYGILYLGFCFTEQRFIVSNFFGELGIEASL